MVETSATSCSMQVVTPDLSTVVEHSRVCMVVVTGGCDVTLFVKVVRVLVLAIVVNRVRVGAGMQDIAFDAAHSVQRASGADC